MEVINYVELFTITTLHYIKDSTIDDLPMLLEQP